MNEPSLDIAAGDFSSPELMKLSAQEQQKLTEILDRYMRAQEQGLPLDQEAVLAEHPTLAEALRIYLRSLSQLHDVAAGFVQATPAEQSEPSEQKTGCLGDFELLREIGRGGMGVVYEARQISLNRRVAVKLLPFAAVLSARQIARFKHEAQAAAHVQHPNIVPVFAIGVERGVHYYAMQFIDGQPLDRAIMELSRGQGLPRQSSLWSGSKSRSEFFETVARLGIQAAEALHAAHEYGVVHRDIKPSNLLLEPEGKIWVTDFGLARFQRSQTLTRTGDLVGTMKYMSPEQAAGRPELVDHRTDIYSLGATLYELLCWQPAFSEQDGPALLKKIERIEPPRPREVRRDIPEDLENIVLKAMAKDRTDRYASAAQLAADLQCFLAGKPIVARPLGRFDRAMKWSWRHRMSIAASMAMLVLVVIGLTITTVQFGRQKSRAEKNVARADRYLNDARQVLDRFGVQLAERLEEVPGAEEVRRELLQETCEYYRHFVEEASGDPALRGDLAVAYGKLATLLGEAGSDSEALTAQQMSVKLFLELVADQPKSLENQKGLALSQNNLAIQLARQSQPEEAKLQYAAAIARQRTLVARFPQDAALAGDLAASLGNYGLMQRDGDGLKEARGSFEEAVALLKKLGGNECRLAAAYNNLAATYVATEPERAATWHEQALQLLEKVAASEGADRGLRREMAVTLSNLGSVWSRSSSAEKALPCYERAIQMQTELTRIAPATVSYQRDLAVSHNNLGLLHGRYGRTEQAEQEFRLALAICKPLATRNPRDAALLSSVAGIYNNLGIALEGSSRFESAAEAFAKAIENQQAAVLQSPETPRYAELLGKHQDNRRRVLQQLGHNPEATSSTL